MSEDWKYVRLIVATTQTDNEPLERGEIGLVLGSWLNGDGKRFYEVEFHPGGSRQETCAALPEEMIEPIEENIS